MNQKKITLDTERKSFESIIAMQGDNKSRYIDATIVNRSIPLDLTGCTVKFSAIKPDITDIFNDAVISDAKGGKVKIELTNQTLAVPGVIQATLVILKEDMQLSVLPFFITVIENPYNPNAIESKSEYKALNNALTVVDGYAKELQDASVNLEEKYTTRLNNFGSQLDNITHGVINYNKGIFTIIDDDGYSSFINRWKPICDSKGIKISIAINTDRVGNGACMTLEQLKQLKSEGYDLLSHSANHPNMNTTLLEDLETDWKRSLQYMKDNNLGDDLAIVYPVGLLDIATEQRVLDIKSLTRRYYKYGIDANIGVGGNSLPVDSYEIKRRFFNPTTYNLSTIKSAIDNAKTNNEWLILLTHCGMDNQWSDETSPTIYNEIIDYVQSIGMPIMTFRQGEKLIGNVISHGDSRTKNFNFVSKNGATWGRSRKDYVNQMEVSSMNALISEYPKYVVHRQQISNLQDTFLGKGGVLETYHGDSMFSYQLFYVAQSNSVYKRTYNDISKTWSSFTGLVGNDFIQILTLNNNWTGTLTATKNSNGMVTIKGSLIVGTNNNTIITNLPTGYRPIGQTPVIGMKSSTNTSVIPFSIFTNGNIITTASNGLSSDDVIEVCFTFSTI